MARVAAAAVPAVERFFELSLLGLVTSGYLAVAGSGYLDPPTALLTGAGLALRALAVAGVLRFDLAPRRVAALTIGYIGFYPLDYLFISGEFLAATVHLVFFLAVLKILTARTGRDHAFVAVIAFLELLAAAVLSANVSFFVFLALFLVFGVATAASAEIRRSLRGSGAVARGGLRRIHWRLAGLTVAIAVGILVLTGGLFFLLPRTAQAAFRHLSPQRFQIPGFSNEVALGQIGEIQQRRLAVMHIRIPDGRQPLDVKWRGGALSQFDGRRWFNPPVREPLRVVDGVLRLADENQQRRVGRRLSYEVQLNAIGADALFFAGKPEFLWINQPLVFRAANESYRLGLGSADGLRYGAHSFIDEPLPDQPPRPVPSEVLDCCLQLPPIDPRIGELARRITRGFTSAEKSALAVEDYLRRNYRYTLELPSEEVPDPLAHFLFERRKGHCEYFASAMAVMLRTIGIPSRVATGFQSGVFNPVSGWYVVRASDAHSWVEAYLPGPGWTTFDPTPPAPNPPRVSLWTTLAFYLDAAETFWQEWVLSYDLDRQLVLATRMQTSGRSFGARWFDAVRDRLAGWKAGVTGWIADYGPALVMIALASAALATLGPKAWRWRKTRQRLRKVQRGEAHASDATLLYQQMLAVLRRRGIEKPPWLTPFEFVRLLPSAQTAALVEQFTALYNDVRFGGRAEVAPRMLELLQQLEEAAVHPRD